MLDQGPHGVHRFHRGSLLLPGNYAFALQKLYRNRKLDPDPADINQYDEDSELIPVGATEPDKVKYSDALSSRESGYFH